jgi:nickel-dependent lactate racemase
VRWEIHDPTKEGSCGYLATSAGGERVYLARGVLDADFVLPITLASFDPLQGTRSPMSVFYPGLSTPEAFAKTHGQGHRELRPEDDRPLRQLIEEIGWLLGVQFAVQLVPGGRRGATADVLAGGAETVQRQALQQLHAGWRAAWPTRAETVVVTVPTADGVTTWDEVGQALETARNVVAHGGKIVVLTDLQAPPGPGMEQLRGQPSARAALQPLREQAPPDLQAASQWANAADWARIYLLSRLESDLVEELFCVPLREVAEVERLMATVEECAVIQTAQSTFAEIVEL